MELTDIVTSSNFLADEGIRKTRLHLLKGMRVQMVRDGETDARIVGAPNVVWLVMNSLDAVYAAPDDFVVYTDGKVRFKRLDVPAIADRGEQWYMAGAGESWESIAANYSTQENPLSKDTLCNYNKPSVVGLFAFDKPIRIVPPTFDDDDPRGFYWGDRKTKISIFLDGSLRDVPTRSKLELKMEWVWDLSLSLKSFKSQLAIALLKAKRWMHNGKNEML